MKSLELVKIIWAVGCIGFGSSFLLWFAGAAVLVIIGRSTREAK